MTHAGLRSSHEIQAHRVEPRGDGPARLRRRAERPLARILRLRAGEPRARAPAGVDGARRLVACGRLRPNGAWPSTRTIASRLAVFQVLGFLALEGAERAAAGGHVLDALTEPVVALGVLVQVVVALAGALVARGIVEAVDRLVSARVVE